ncbi:tRNA N6-adenosine threonylcarbamoyltransferase, mitochondrial-like [Periophthalmus magnuspinnatus]|uniref:tRNA N6-adenosine threonylcarbamoyltransferase, mitochondrial-like n=1 Tax=Periophthalmus magnuspinnatus TaxID=409849 RepID=UPI00145BB9B5|nr:tRNA N6-adenosine threonylcarbamoyltransferase, mitochondrial-like [Periophthalmus magnuspinnatus]
METLRDTSRQREGSVTPRVDPQVARRLSLLKHPLCSSLSGGQAVEVLAQTGDPTRFKFTTPMGQTLDCNFSFAGLRNQVSMAVKKREEEEGVERGTLLSCVNDLAASAQHTVAAHLAKRTHRAVLFCKHNRLLPDENPTLVLSGGVASNKYIRKALSVITDREGLRLLCPPPTGLPPQRGRVVVGIPARPEMEKLPLRNSPVDRLAETTQRRALSRSWLVHSVCLLDSE